MNRLKIITIPLLLFFWCTVSGASNLPDLGEPSETFISRAKEKQLGREFMRMVRANLPLLKDTIINDYIQNLGNRLTSKTNTRGRKFRFFVVDDSAINAFAGPDAYIGINSGSIKAVQSENELAAIMAHEIAHVTQHHIARLINTAKKTQAAAAAGMLAALIIGSTGNSKSLNNLASGAAMASIGSATQHMISFTKEHEIEADNIGMQILYRSSFDPNAMPNAFERMQRLRFAYINETPKFFLTHPVTTDRIAEAKNRASQYKFKPTKQNSTFSLIQIRTEVLTSDNLPQLIKTLRTKLHSKKKNNRKILEYGLALALYKNFDIAETTKIAYRLQKQSPNEVLFQMLTARIERTNKQADKAFDRLKRALIKHSNYYPLILQYADALTKAKRSQEAQYFIRKKLRSYPNDVRLYYLLARAYAENNRKGDAYIAKAKAYEIRDHNQQALALLQQALKIPKLSTNNRAIINARISRLKKIKK